MISPRLFASTSSLRESVSRGIYFPMWKNGVGEGDCARSANHLQACKGKGSRLGLQGAPARVPAIPVPQVEAVEPITQGAEG